MEKTYVLAEQILAATTVEAMAAELSVVSGDAVANFEVGNLRSDSGDNSHGFVSGNQGKLGNELALVNMLYHVPRIS